jgi:hypothetical protein
MAGGMFLRVMEFYEIDWTAVEIDRKVAELARAYFGFRGQISLPDGDKVKVDLSRYPNRAITALAEHVAAGGEAHAAVHDRGPPAGDAVIQDGRQYLATHPERVDFIVLDAYSSDTIPFHLITREFFELLRSRLTDNGMRAINYIGPRGEAFVTGSLFGTLGVVFGPDNLLAFRSRDDPSAVQVVTIFAMIEPRELNPWLWLEEAPPGGVDRFSAELNRRRLQTDRDRGIVITDDLNPIDLARAQTALRWRQQTMKILEK